MTKTRLLVMSGVATALSMSLISVAQSGPAPAPKFEAEKCYGIAKAGKNDCKTNTSSCAGTSKRDGQADACIYIPKGSCDRVVGGSLQPSRG